MRWLLSLILLTSACKADGDDSFVIQPTPQTSANQWRDPVEGKRWFVSAALVVWEDAEEACAIPYRLPLATELRTARSRGICSAHTCGVVWSSSIARTEALTVDMSTGTSGVSKKDQAVGMIFCRET